MSVLETATVTVTIDAPFDTVAADLADPTTHGEWGTEFFAGPVIPDEGGDYRTEVPAMGGPVRYRVEADTGRGIVDVYLAPEGAPFGPPIPVRLIHNGDGVDVLWTLARFPGVPEPAFRDGLASMERELQQLRRRHEDV